MSTQHTDLEYVSNTLKKAEASRSGYPTTYCLWGVITFFGFAVWEFYVEYTGIYWAIFGSIGGLLSWWLSERDEKRQGQQDKELGLKYMWHFIILTTFIWAAVFTQQYLTILLILSMGYITAGLYLDRTMFIVGGIALVAYILVYLDILNSFLVVGSIFSLGFFVSAWTTSRPYKATS